MVETPPGKSRVGIGRGPVNYVESLVLEAAAKKSHEVGVGFHHDENGVGTHPPENLRSECADARTVLEEDPAAIPIHFRQDMVDEKA